MVDMATLEGHDSRSWVIRPRVHLQLSEFCKTLTGITQLDVEGGVTFDQLYGEIDAWLAPYRDGLGWSSWGNYDRRQLDIDAARLNRQSPLADVPHIDLKKLFAVRHRIKGTRPSLGRALELCELQFEGRPHRGVDDARNAARILPWLLTKRLEGGR